MKLPLVTKAEELDIAKVYQEHGKALYGYLLTLLKDPVLTEEVMAMSLEKAYRKQKKYLSQKGSQRSWLFTLARNTALDEMRRAKRQAQPSEIEDHLLREEDFTGQVATKLTLQEAVRSLPAKERELLALRFYADLSNREIAQMTGTNESQIGTRLYRALNKLREVYHD